MGGGLKTSSAYYGIKRKSTLAMRAIERTGRVYGVKLSRKGRGLPETSVVSENSWKKKFPHLLPAAGLYIPPEDRLYVRRKYFAGRHTQNVITHEILHSLSGPFLYKSGKTVSCMLEEGTVEYMTQATMIHGYRGAGKRYARGHPAYHDEVQDVSRLMAIVGRKKFLEIWHRGFNASRETKTMRKYKNEAINAAREGDYQKRNAVTIKYESLFERNLGHRELARELSKKGFKQTAKLIVEYYKSTEAPRRCLLEYIEEDYKNMKHQDQSRYYYPLRPSDEE